MSGRHRAPRRVAETSEHRSSLYLESSALLAAVIETDTAAIARIRGVRTVASALTFAEARRTLIRALHTGRFTHEHVALAEAELQRIESRCEILEITDAILARVGRRFPAEPIRTLDAIHLASAELLDDPLAPVTLLTRDLRIRENALLLGMQVA